MLHFRTFLHLVEPGRLLLLGLLLEIRLGWRNSLDEDLAIRLLTYKDWLLHRLLHHLLTHGRLLLDKDGRVDLELRGGEAHALHLLLVELLLWHHWYLELNHALVLGSPVLGHLGRAQLSVDRGRENYHWQLQSRVSRAATCEV